MWCDVLGRGWSWVYQVGGAGSRGDSRGLASQDGVAVLVHVVVEVFLGVGQVSILVSGRCRWDTGLSIHACLVMSCDI